MIGYTNKAAVLYGGCQPNTYYKLTFHYSSLYASFFTNSDYVIFLMEFILGDPGADGGGERRSKQA